MKNEQLITQIEMYSNAVVGFLVVQAIGYSMAFGTNSLFNCLLKVSEYLAVGMLSHFVLSTIGACVMLDYLRRTIQRLSDENAGILSRIFAAKMIAIVVFSLVPIGITYAYAVRDYPDKLKCEASMYRSAD